MTALAYCDRKYQLLRAVLFWNRGTKGNGAPCHHPRWGESTFGGSQSQRTKYFGRKVRWWMTLFCMLLSWLKPNVFKSCNSQPSPFHILCAVLIEPWKKYLLPSCFFVFCFVYLSRLHFSDHQILPTSPCVEKANNCLCHAWAARTVTKQGI